MGYIRLCIYKSALSMHVHACTVGYRDKGVHMVYVYRYIVCMCMCICVYCIDVCMHVYSLICVCVGVYTCINDVICVMCMYLFI